MNVENRIKAIELAIQHKAIDAAANVIGTAESFLDFIEGRSAKPAQAQPEKPAAAQTASAPTVSQPAAPTQAAASQSPPAAQTATTPVAPAVSYEADIGPKITAVSRAGSAAKAELIALLDKFGAKRGPEVKAADYPAFLAELVKLAEKHIQKAA
jgi:hypothetical protein